MSESAPRHGMSFDVFTAGRPTVTRVRRRAEAASPRTATGARRLAVDATAKDIGRELECVNSSERDGRWRHHQIRLPLSGLRRATDRCGVRPPKNK